MKPVGPLMREHRLIERVLPVLRHLGEMVSRYERIDPAHVSAVSDFLHVYADRLHHGKEEDILFKVLLSKPMTTEHRSTMEDLVRDHVRGRTLTKILDAAGARYVQGDAAASSDLLDAIQGLTDLYPDHIDAEDHRFFLPCMEYLTVTEQAEMLEEFDRFDKQVMHEKYANVTASLESEIISLRR